MRTPSMSRKLCFLSHILRKSESSSAAKKGLFVGEPVLASMVGPMINHSHELAHWVAAEVLSCGSSKVQASVVTKFLQTANMCLEARNYSSALAIYEGLENLVVKQLPVWKNIAGKHMGYLETLGHTKMKVKSE